jgi:hypothetical protein
MTTTRCKSTHPFGQLLGWAYLEPNFTSLPDPSAIINPCNASHTRADGFILVGAMPGAKPLVPTPPLLTHAHFGY